MFLIYVTLYQDFGLCLDRPHRDENFILPKKKFGSSGGRGLNRHGLPHSTTRLVVFVVNVRPSSPPHSWFSKLASFLAKCSLSAWLAKPAGQRAVLWRTQGKTGARSVLSCRHLMQYDQNWRFCATFGIPGMLPATIMWHFWQTYSLISYDKCLVTLTICFRNQNNIHFFPWK